MIRSRAFTLFLLIQWALLAGHAAHGNEPAVLVFGDSISAALGVPNGAGWVDLLRERLAREHPREVINASISGETSEGGKARLPALLAEHRPGIVVLELGANDALRGFPLTLTQSNLLALITAARASGADVLLLGMRIPPNYGPRYTEQFQSMYRDLAARTGVASVAFLLQGIAPDPALMQEDGIHPRAEAQPMILDNVLPALTPLLRK
ncbi:MAG: arylesterase [Gammaproteobacteria bacterium]|nr:arylesterase [Gammaproteobacteria bacterium]